jgi:hypothetical protein
MSESVALYQCQKKLAVLWLVGSAIPLLTILIQSLTGFWQGRDQEAWGWVLPALLPTLTLIVGSIVVTDGKPESEKREVPRLTYRIAFWISAFYLFAVLLTLRSVAGKSHPIDILHRSSWLLGAVQGLVGTSLGVFFSSARLQKAQGNAAKVPSASDG